MTLTPQEEAFCAAYAEGASGAEAARLADYSAANARNQASRMLTRPYIMDRVSELTAEFVRRRACRQEELAAKLDPIYEKALTVGDDDGVIQIIELQSRILGFVKGGGAQRGTFQQRAFEREKHARAEEERRNIQEAWDEFDEEDRLRALEEAEREEREEAEAEAEVETVRDETVIEAAPEPTRQPEPEPEFLPPPTEPEPTPEPAKASISQHSTPAATRDEILHATAQARHRFRERQRNLNNRP